MFPRFFVVVSPFATARSLTHSSIKNVATPSPKHELKCMQVYDMLWLCIRCIHVIHVHVWLVDYYVFFHTAALVIVSAISTIVVTIIVIVVIIVIISVLAFAHLHIRKNRTVKLGI